MSGVEGAVIKFLDEQSEEEYWGIYELAQRIGYSYSHLARHTAHSAILDPYMAAYYKGRKLMRIFGSKEAIRRFYTEFEGTDL